MGDEVKPNHNKRKRKKSFLMNARKYAKKGTFGRGSRLDADTYQYFVKIMEAYKEGFDSDEAKHDFANNVFDQTNENEMNCICNQVGCRVVEMLLPFANDAVLERYMNVFSAELRPLCSDRFATHVLEALVTETCKKSLQIEDEELKLKYRTFTIKIAKFLLNNLEDYLWDTYGNHVIRTVILNFAGLPREEAKTNTLKTSEEKVKNEGVIDEEYKGIVEEYAERLLSWPQFKDLAFSEVTSAFLQILLKALRKVNKSLLKKYLVKLLDESFFPGYENSNESLPEAFFSSSCMMLLETALEVSKSKMFTQIYAKGFSSKLVKLATTRSTNFAVQKLINNAKDKTEFENIFNEFDEHFKEIIEVGHTGVILALAQACKRLSAKQGPYVQNLMKALNCMEPEERQNSFVICLCRLKNFEENQKMSLDNLEKEKLKLHGTLILQVMLEFNKPIKIVNGLLNLEPNDLKNLFSNTMGSHIVDSYVTSQFVGEKSREKLTRRLQGTYQDLVNSKYGSRSFEAIWGAANLKFKMNILNELGYKDALWTNSEFGKIISSKINYPLYKRNKEDWKASLNQTDKKKNFLDFLDE